MSLSVLVGGIILAVILAALDSMFRPQTLFSKTLTDDNMSTHNHHKPFTIEFEDGQAQAVKVGKHDDADAVIDMLNLKKPSPAIFITGGASLMHEDDVRRTQDIMENGITRFAAENNVTIIDGGTEAGVMQMVGEARQKHHHAFPLIGVAPYGKIAYPGRYNPKQEAELEDHHSHFVLIDADEWGAESQMIVNLSHAITGGKYPALGILINGGKIAERDVYLATSKQEPKITILVLEGSGRKADEIATAFKTGQASQKILKAIIEGGDIKLLATTEGADAMYQKLTEHFQSSIQG